MSRWRSYCTRVLLIPSDAAFSSMYVTDARSQLPDVGVPESVIRAVGSKHVILHAEVLNSATPCQPMKAHLDC